MRYYITTFGVHRDIRGKNVKCRHDRLAFNDRHNYALGFSFGD